jgi:hypothetical protein
MCWAALDPAQIDVKASFAARRGDIIIALQGYGAGQWH